jgi:hypothetical protein
MLLERRELKAGSGDIEICRNPMAVIVESSDTSRVDVLRLDWRIQGASM